MSQPTPLPQEFFNRPTLQVAHELLGKYLIKEGVSDLVRARIVDVEAYVGPEDLACHASKGRTKRTEIMFGPAGRTYVYLIYGMYHCLNLVTEAREFPAAVLVRGIEVSEGGEPGGAFSRIDGPGRVCRYLQIDRSWNGWDATLGRKLWIEDGGDPISSLHIQALPRVGVDYAGEWAHKPWRLCLHDRTPPPKPRTSRTSRKAQKEKSGIS